MSGSNQKNDVEVCDDNVDPDMAMTGIDQTDSEQDFQNYMESELYEPNDRRQDFKRDNNRQGSLSKGNWRQFNRGRGWAPVNYRGPGSMWGRGFGPAGPPIPTVPDSMPLRYLMRCGVPKEKLKNLPRGFLQLISPAYCGVCDEPLFSFDMSQAHYTSSYHYKKQKKWIFYEYQQLNGYQLHTKKEPALKPRDAYCELCDVQITSKVHADSHYAGKSHRAVVDGRKLPKNVRLLNKGMENRVELLIRREQKNLKPIEDEPKPEQPEKVFQPELYCEVCKTTVTCSEQMRMHLNGKKHLNKEKQYILNMMKGNGATDDNAKIGEGESDDKDDDAAEQVETANDEINYDWGNGSGAWDDTQETTDH